MIVPINHRISSSTVDRVSLLLLLLCIVFIHTHLRRPFLLYKFIPNPLVIPLPLLRSRSKPLHSPSTPCNENKTPGLYGGFIPSSFMVAMTISTPSRSVLALSEIAFYPASLISPLLLCCCCCCRLAFFVIARLLNFSISPFSYRDVSSSSVSTP